MSNWLHDFNWGVRRLVRSPVFSVTVILTLALGIGANTTIFSIVNSLLLQPLPYPEPGQLVTLNHIYPSHDLVAGVSPPGFRDYRERTGCFTEVAITRGWGANLTGVAEPLRVSGSRVSSAYFETYGIAPRLGRSFLPEEDVPGNQYVVVVSDGFWKRHLGSDPNAVGSTVQLNEEPYQVIGVMPSGFADFFNNDRELWVPIALPPERFSDDFRSNENQQSVARVKPGVSVAAAAEEITALAETIKREFPDAYPSDWTVGVKSLDEVATSSYRMVLLVLLGAVGFVLLITCANVANLLLAQGIDRRKELAIRKALGAERSQVMRQLLTESLILSLGGGVAGLLLAHWGVRALVLIGPDILASTDIVIDGRVLLFTLGIAVASGLLFGLAPAFQAGRHDIQKTLREGGRGSRTDRSGHSLRRLLIAGEFALALILLTGAGLMIQSISHLSQVDPGFKPDNLLTAFVQIPPARYQERESQAVFYEQLLQELEAVPGVSSAAITSVLPFSGNWSTSTFNVEGYLPDDNSPAPWGDIRLVSPSFAETLGVPLLKGRFFNAADLPDSLPVTVVDEEMASRFWPDQDPIGKRITFDNPADEEPGWLTVIGVVGHTLHAGLDDQPRVQLYFSARQYGLTGVTLVIRTEMRPETALPGVRQAVLSVDPNLPISQVRIMDDLITESVGNRKLLMLLLTLFSALAMLLASLGIYGIMAHMVRERASELGLRAALGASRMSLFGFVINRGLSLAGIGLAVGVGGSLALTRLLQSQLYGVSAYDSATLVSVVGILLGVALLAVCIPANRAAQVDPMENLRAE
jgi:predicted permease